MVIPHPHAKMTRRTLATMGRVFVCSGFWKRLGSIIFSLQPNAAQRREQVIVLFHRMPLLILPDKHSPAYYRALKWLRYYPGFCHRHDFPPLEQDSLPQFILKLNEKGQTLEQQRTWPMATPGRSW
jgi:hypothetical protein